MSELVLVLSFFAFAVVVWPGSESIEIERIASGGYVQQATVRRYPNRALSLLGLKPVERVFVSQYGTPGSSGWCELPDMNQLSCITRLAERIERRGKQAQFIGEAS